LRQHDAAVVGVAGRGGRTTHAGNSQERRPAREQNPKSLHGFTIEQMQPRSHEVTKKTMNVLLRVFRVFVVAFVLLSQISSESLHGFTIRTNATTKSRSHEENLFLLRVFVFSWLHSP
jgi:hypothetical protein